MALKDIRLLKLDNDVPIQRPPKGGRCGAHFPSRTAPLRPAFSGGAPLTHEPQGLRISLQNVKRSCKTFDLHSLISSSEIFPQQLEGNVASNLSVVIFIHHLLYSPDLQSLESCLPRNACRRYVNAPKRRQVTQREQNLIGTRQGISPNHLS